MWIWEGHIVPMPGESIEDAALEAIWLANRYRAGRKGDQRTFFEMDFNGVKLKIYRDSTVQDVLKDYFGERHAGYAEARRKYG